MTGPGRTPMTPGWIAAAIVAVVYIGIAFHVDIPRGTGGLHSDEATYYLMAHSLASDGDLAYRAEDLARSRRELPDGPSGVFLKQGSDVDGVRLTSRPPFVELERHLDPDPTRLYFGKAFIYPAFAAPFVRVFGTRGFLIFNAILLGLSIAAAYAFLAARSRPSVALVLAGAFVMASVVPVYAQWMMPEIFNFALGLFAYFLWTYKLVAPARTDTRCARWLRGPWSDAAAAVLIGIATFSKVTNGLLVVPMILWWLWRRDWRRTAAVALVSGAVAIGLFGVNVAVSGDWNYQGPPRNTFYGHYPFETPDRGFDVGAERARGTSLIDVIFDREVFWTNLRANAEYFVVGRYSGLLPYFAPSLVALAAFLLSRRRAAWQWLIVGMVGVHALAFIITQPYTYFGSGGSVGDRYFMGAYGACLFLFPPVDAIAVAIVPWIVGGLFVGKIVLHPFVSSVRPADAAKRGPLRLLPVELTNVNDLPIMTEADRVRIWYGDTGEGDPGFQIYYLDDNSYLPEADRKSFWIRGDARAEMLFKATEPFGHARFQLSTGASAADVVIRVNGHDTHVALGANGTADVRLPLGPAFPYKRYEAATYVWVVSIRCRGGFTPPKPADGSPGDARYLGVRVRPTIHP